MAGFRTGFTPASFVDSDGFDESVVWDDVNASGAILTLAAANNPGKVEFKTSGGVDTGITTYGMAVGEKLSGAFELPHKYKDGSTFYPHLHYQIIDAPAGGTDKVKFKLTYSIVRGGALLTAVTSIYAESDVTTQYSFITSEFTAITGTGIRMGDQFLFTLERVAASTDDFAGEALLATVGLHYQIDTLGSKQKATKR